MGWLVAFGVLVASLVNNVPGATHYEKINGLPPYSGKTALTYCSEHKRTTETLDKCMYDLGYRKRE